MVKITIELKDGRVVELTVDEAKDLHKQLGDLLGKNTAPPVDIPYVPWTFPPTYPTYPWEHPVITCEDS